ncbi:putative toxin 15 [compost metagenome]
MGKLDALHEPDMVVGGWANPNPSGLGNSNINKSIGGHWNQDGRIPMLDHTAQGATKRGDGGDLMNVELTICPPKAKGQ